MSHTVTLDYDGYNRRYETQSYNDAIVLVDALTRIHSGARVCLLDEHGRETYIYDPNFT